MKETDALLTASSRVGLAGLLHDLGKLAERAGLEVDKQRLEDHLQMYARKNEHAGRIWYSHRHSAYTALALDEIERLVPEIVGDDMTPFADWGSRDTDDSIVNAAASHHRPGTFLQWVIATADRVASGFEREMFEKYNKSEEPKNHITSRQLPLFEQIRIHSSEPVRHAHRYPLHPLSVESMFPLRKEEVEGEDTTAGRQEYGDLWQQLVQGLADIPVSHRRDLTLWLDHFESLWGVVTQAVPSATAFGTRPDVSLYDHSRATAALSVALWRYHHERDEDSDQVVSAMSRRQDWSEDKFLLVQGDLFGIQSFIFATGGETQKRSAKLLRGRSFYVALLAELASLKVLEALALPGVSRVINAAGKFLIVAPNTNRTRSLLGNVQREMDQWFLRHTYGGSGIGLAWLPASCNDFVSGATKGKETPFQGLVSRLFERLEEAKARRFDLCGEQPISPVFEDFLSAFHNEKGVCRVDGKSPGEVELDVGVWVSQLAKDQIELGGWLTRFQRILITNTDPRHNTLSLPVFGYRISFTSGEDISGRFKPLVEQGSLRRLWDYELPAAAGQTLWNGYARRQLNAWVPRFGDANQYEADKYQGVDDGGVIEPGAPKTLNHIACEALTLNDRARWIGVPALITLKGDVDGLGDIFQKGLTPPTFAKWAALSRQIDAFFSTYLPWLCSSEYPDTYTVFAGGDDFFLIGPWRQTLDLASRLRQEFTRYVAGNPELHFSAGLVMTKPGYPVRALGNIAEVSLERAKAHNPQQLKIPPKNAVTAFDRCVTWDKFEHLMQARDRLEQLTQEMALSTRYVYGMIYLCEMAGAVKQRPENAMWHSRFAYRTRRMLERITGLGEEQRRAYQDEITSVIAGGIEKFGEDYKIALFSHLYRHRD